MLRFLLVLVTCTVPFHSVASTYHADNHGSYHHEIITQTAFRPFPHQWRPAASAADKKRLSRYDIWQPKIGHVVKAANVLSPTPPQQTQTPGLIQFKDRPYPPQFVPARPNRIAASGPETILVVPLASSFFFMLTLMIGAFITQQRDHIRRVTTYARLFLTCTTARKL